MAIEREIKFVVASGTGEEVVQKIEEKNSTLTMDLYEKTMMFDNEGQLMSRRDARLRVRQIGMSKDGVSDVEFSYKRRLRSDEREQIDAHVKQEEEIETAFRTNVHEFIQILECMGYHMVSSYERYRKTRDYLGTKVTVDTFPFGIIIEIEGAEDSIVHACSVLGLEVENSTLESCDDVYDRLCRERGIEPHNHISFSDSDMPKIEM